VKLLLVFGVKTLKCDNHFPFELLFYYYFIFTFERKLIEIILVVFQEILEVHEIQVLVKVNGCGNNVQVLYLFFSFLNSIDDINSK